MTSRAESRASWVEKLSQAVRDRLGDASKRRVIEIEQRPEGAIFDQLGGFVGRLSPLLFGSAAFIDKGQPGRLRGFSNTFGRIGPGSAERDPPIHQEAAHVFRSAIRLHGEKRQSPSSGAKDPDRFLERRRSVPHELEHPDEDEGSHP